jgi:hypothetical protein
MCSLLILPSWNSTIATVGTSTRRPVGATPGRNQSIATVCVHLKIISSTIRSRPMVREISSISVSGGSFGMKCVA